MPRRSSGHIAPLRRAPRPRAARRRARPCSASRGRPRRAPACAPCPIEQSLSRSSTSYSIVERSCSRRSSYSSAVWTAAWAAFSARQAATGSAADVTCDTRAHCTSSMHKQSILTVDICDLHIMPRHERPLPNSGLPWLRPEAWITLLVLCGVLFLDGLDVSMVGVALPSIDSDLNLSTSTLQWVVSGYVLGYGGLLLLGGRTADLLGRKRVLIVALAVFALASLLGALVDSGPLLIAARFIKGAAAGFTAPAGLSIITTTFPEGAMRNRALGHLHRHRRERLLARSRARRPADDGRLALDLPAPVPDRGRALVVAAKVLRPDPPRDAHGPLRRRRRRRGDRRDAGARVRHLRRAGRGLDVGPDARLPGRGRGARRRVLRDRAARRASARAPRDPAVAGDRGREPRRHGGVRVLLRVPVHGHAVHAAAAGLVRARRPRWRSCPPACSSRSARRAWARWRRASAPRR